MIALSCGEKLRQGTSKIQPTQVLSRCLQDYQEALPKEVVQARVLECSCCCSSTLNQRVAASPGIKEELEAGLKYFSIHEPNSIWRFQVARHPEFRTTKRAMVPVYVACPRVQRNCLQHIFNVTLDLLFTLLLMISLDFTHPNRGLTHRKMVTFI